MSLSAIVSKMDGVIAYVGNSVGTDLENPDNIHLRKVTVDSDDVIGKSLRDMRLRKNHGTTVTRMCVTASNKSEPKLTVITGGCTDDC